MNQKSVLVIGGSGFLGGHMAEGFATAGWRVTVGLRELDKRTHHLEDIVERYPSLKSIFIDLTERPSLARAISSCKPDIIINCAAYGVDYREQDYSLALQVNVTAVNDIVSIASQEGVKRVIHVGTAYEYGDRQELIREDFPLMPMGVYATTKAAGSITAIDHAKKIKLPLVIVRPFVMFGPYEGKHKFIPTVASACLNKSRLNLSPGEQVRDFVYVTDVVDACICIVEAIDFPEWQVINIGTGETVSLRGIGAMIADHIGNGGQYLHWGSRAYRPDELMSCVANVEKMKLKFNWSPNTPLNEALRTTIDWQTKQGC